MNGPTQREWEDMAKRVHELEQTQVTMREEHARMRGAAGILGFIGGLFAAAIVTAVVRAIWGG